MKYIFAIILIPISTRISIYLSRVFRIKKIYNNILCFYNEMSAENIQSDLSEIIKEFNLCKNNKFTENIKMLRDYKYNILDIRNIINNFEKDKFTLYEKRKKYIDFSENFKNKNYNFF